MADEKHLVCGLPKKRNIVFLFISTISTNFPSSFSFSLFFFFLFSFFSFFSSSFF